MFRLKKQQLFFPVVAVISVVVMVFFISYSLSQESYAVSAFTEAGEHTWIVPEGVNSVDVLVVAGGGGGGKRHGAGGGAGGVLYTENYSVSSGQIINITVGSGGAGATSVARSTNGEDSVFSSLTAIGGGGGGQYDTYRQGLPGGSGGGSSKSYNAAGTPNQGNAGGAGTASSPYNWGGGGGAGEPGYNGTTTSHGSGGEGLYYGDIFGNQYGENGWFGGGGGGGGHNPAATIRGFGGNGGGGDGGTPNTYQDGENGLPNTGGGGGGASTIGGGTNIGGNGGSGIVLIKYRVKLGTAQTPTMYKGLVGHWSMDASDYNNINGRLTDSSPNSNHGTIFGATFTEDRFGKEGGAMSFDGNNYIDCKESSVFVMGNNDFTMGAWVYPVTVSSSYNYIISIGNSATGQQAGLGIRSNSGLFLSAYTTPIVNTSYTLPGLNDWYHIMVSYNGNTDTASFFVNGQLVENEIINLNTTVGKCVIGAHTGKTSFFNSGYFDDVRIYNRALSESEIQSLYDSYNPKTTTGTLQQGLVLDMPLKLKYTKSETPGSEIMTDRTPYSNDGQNYGAIITSDGASFDGVDDYIRLPNEIISTANIRSKGVTYAAWIKLVNTGSSQKIIGQKPGSGYSDFSSGGLGVNTSNKAIMIAYDDGASYKYATGDTNLQSNVWHFLVGTYNPIDKNIRIYVDGLSDGTPVLINTFSRLNVNADNTIGRQTHSVSPGYFNGQISNILIYNRALSDEEVKTLYDRGRGDTGIVFRPYGSSQDSPGLSCKDILETNPSAQGLDGLYWINPSGSETFQVYCDMTTDGGGWTLVEKDYGGSSAVPVSSTEDTNTTVLLNNSWSTAEGKYADSIFKSIWLLGDRELLWRKSTGEYIKMRYSEDFINNYWFSNFHYADKPSGVFQEFYRYADGNWYAIIGHYNNWHFSNYNDDIVNFSSYRRAKDQNDNDAYWPTRSTGLMDNQSWLFHMYIR